MFWIEIEAGSIQRLTQEVSELYNYFEKEYFNDLDCPDKFQCISGICLEKPQNECLLGQCSLNGHWFSRTFGGK